MNTKNMRGITRVNTRGNTRENATESLKPTRYDHTYARSSKHKEIHDPNPSKDNT